MIVFFLTTIQKGYSIVYTVDNASNIDDGGLVINPTTMTLSKCVRLANANAGLDNINFNVATPFICNVSASLVINSPVIIDGLTQPGASAGNLIIQVVCSINTDIFRFNAGSNGSTVK